MFFGKAFVCGDLMWPNKKRYHFLYSKTRARLNEELNIVRLIKTIRNVKVFLEGSLMDKKTQFKIHHQAKNFVNIDLSDPESE